MAMKKIWEGRILAQRSKPLPVRKEPGLQEGAAALQPPGPVTWGCCAWMQSPESPVPPDREVVGRLSLLHLLPREGQEDIEAQVPVPPAAVPCRPCPVPREHGQHRARGLASRHEIVLAVLAARLARRRLRP